MAFRLTYGVGVVIPVEVGELTWRTLHPLNREDNEQARRQELDLTQEVREQAALAEVVVKKRIAKQYNAKVFARNFEIDDLVLRRADIGAKNAGQGKLVSNWEGPYWVTAKIGKYAYTLETLEKKPIPRT